MEINDRALDDFVIRDVEINGVVGAQPRGTPVDLADLAVGVADLQPVADLVRAIYLQRHASDDSAEKILAGNTENDGHDTRADEQALQLSFGVVADTQHQKQSDEKN